MLRLREAMDRKGDRTAPSGLGGRRRAGCPGET